MKYKTATRLAIRLIGLFLTAQALAGLTEAGVFMVADWLFYGAGYYSWAVATAIGQATLLFLGLWLLLSPRAMADRLIPSNRPYCHECGYPLTGLPSVGRCPECGTAYDRPTLDPPE